MFWVLYSVPVGFLQGLQIPSTVTDLNERPSCNRITPAVTHVNMLTCQPLTIYKLVLHEYYFVGSYFKLSLHFDLSYTPVKFHDCIKVNVGQCEGAPIYL